MQELHMNSISLELAKSAVSLFLDSQLNKKKEKEQKQLEKALEKEDCSKVAELQQVIKDIKEQYKEKYQKASWLEDAANRMAKQLYFGTHISKGINPDSKGDNVSFHEQHELPVEILGTHSLNSQYLDANGNAAALPLAAFFDFELDGKVKIRELILSDNQDFIDSLSPDTETALAYHQAFKSALQNNITTPVSHERNKQILWPTNAYDVDCIDDIDYTTLVPLYPSVFTHEVYQCVNELKYSDENKQARDNRFKQTAEQKPYVSMLDMATLQLGGTKPQNVSLLMSKQGGRNYLLPSMPPIIEWSYSFNLSRFSESIFASKSLKYHCRNSIQMVFDAVKTGRNNLEIRDERKEAIDKILHTLFSIAKTMQSDWPAGWSKKYENLKLSEKYWLDPQRANLEGEEEFKEARDESEWNKEIITNFANWLNDWLKSEFKEIQHEFANPEHNEWEREIEHMQKQYERAGKGVFL